MKIESLWLVRWHMYCLQEIGGPWRIKVKCWNVLMNTILMQDWGWVGIK